MPKLLNLVQIVLLSAGVAFCQTLFRLPEDADTYFVMNLGRYVMEQGFPHVDPFTIHEGLQLVAQQWLSGVIFWEVYQTLGFDGLRLADALLGAATVFIHWRLCLYVSGGNKTLSFALSFVVSLLVTPAIVPRPQLFSTPLLLIEVFLLEKFTRTENFKWLLPLPLIGVAVANLHAAVWLLTLVLCLPFLFVRSVRHGKFMLAAMAGLVIGGLINPYGVDALTYVFRSYGIDAINNNIAEMFTPTAHNLRGKAFYLTAAVLIATLARIKVPQRYVLLSGGLMFMAVMHVRNQALFYFIATFPLAYAWRDFQPEKIFSRSADADYKNRGLLTLAFFLLTFVNTAVATTLLNEKLDRLTVPLGTLLAVALGVVAYNLLIHKFEGRLLHPAILPRKVCSLAATAFIICGVMFATLDNRAKESDDTFAKAIGFLLRDERPENIKLYVGQGIGGLAGMMGVKYYIDSRSEVFLPANNRQKNILQEYLDFTRGRIYYTDFFARYDFTHIIATSKDAVIYNALSRDKNFRVIYESERVEGSEVIPCKVFVPKNEE